MRHFVKTFADARVACDVSTRALARCATAMRQEVKRGSDNAGRPAPDGHFWLSCGAAALLTLVVVAALFGLHEWSSQRQLAAQSVNSLRTAVAVEEEGVFDSAQATSNLQVAANAAFVTATPPPQRSQAFGLAAAGMSLGQGAAMALAGAAAQHLAPAVVIGAAGALGTVASIGLALPLAAGRSPGRAPDHA